MDKVELCLDCGSFRVIGVSSISNFKDEDFSLKAIDYMHSSDSQDLNPY